MHVRPIRTGAALFALVASACGPAPKPHAVSDVDVTQAPPPTDTRFRGHMTIDLVSLASRRVGPEGEAVASDLRERMPAVLACMRAMPPRPTDVWLVGRVGENGRLDDVHATEETPPEVGACASKALGGIRVPSGDPFAVSVVLRGEPAPADCADGDTRELCGVIPVPTAAAPPDHAPEEDIPDASSGVPIGRRRGTPTVRIGATTVEGSATPEVVRSVLRQNLGRFRLCYDNALRSNATLAGTVRIAFTVVRGGTVSSYTPEGGFPDENVVSCAARIIASLTFPDPESGEIRVDASIVLAPARDAGGLTVGGVPFSELTAATVATRLAGNGWRTAVVAGASDGDPFVVFAIEKGTSTSPADHPRSFVTSVRRESATGYTPPDARESEGLRLVAAGDQPARLLDDLVDPTAPAK